MNKRTALRLLLLILFLPEIRSATATNLDTIGVTLLRTVDPSLTGSGIRVAQPEAILTGNNDWEVNPSAVGQPISSFTWYSSAGSTNNFPNTLGNESGHADEVGNDFYGTSLGAAPGVLHVDNYDADYFVNSLIIANQAIPAKVVNQSFITAEPQQAVDPIYDNYIAQNGNLFCSGVGNSGQVYPPATSYNSIGVGAYGGSSSIGPTLDNGRSKPDITAPGALTSFSTPLVSGSAAILLQAAARNDGGAGTSADASDVRTVKALLLNGAIKPADWTHTISAPLDPRYGSGIVNVFNSWKQLSGGKRAPIESSTVNSGDPHLPGGNTNNISSLISWDFRAISNNPTHDEVNHYYFNVPGVSRNSFTLTATLAWNRQLDLTNINDLDLFLYNTATGNLVASSVSTVDNVEHLYLPKLAPGRYDLQVLKNGLTKRITGSEIYALAFEIFAMPLNISKSGSNAVITWPIAPTGFVLESAASLNPPISWTAVTNAIVVSNNLNVVTVNTSGIQRYFRLRR